MLTATVPTHSLRVLVVEDEMLMRWSIAETLAAAGHVVVEAETGAAALDALSTSAADAVMLDYWLPDSNDLSLLARIRRLAPSTPVILMTAYGTPELADAARQLGACAVLDKPFDMHNIEEIVARACSPVPS